MIRPVNDGRDKLVVKYKELNAIYNQKEEHQKRQILYPSPLHHFPESSVVSVDAVKDPYTLVSVKK